jgi:hypothetical protein
MAGLLFFTLQNKFEKQNCWLADLRNCETCRIATADLIKSNREISKY